MIALEKNVKYLWQKRDIPEGSEYFLCLYSFRSQNIHLRFVKGSTGGEYFVSCYSPRLVKVLPDGKEEHYHSYDLRQLIYVAFIELYKLTNDPYHKNTIRRMFDFLERLKNEPELMFND